MNVNENITKLKGVGDKTAQVYGNVGIEKVDDLIHYYPRDYIKYEKLSPSQEFEADKIFAFEAIVLGRPLVKRVKRLQITTASLNAGGMLVSATWFHMPYLNKTLVPGKPFVFRGKLIAQGDHYRIEQAQIFTKEQFEEISEKITPIYPLTKGLTNNGISKVMKTAFASVSQDEYEEGLFSIHFPKDYEELGIARRSLVFDEFLLFILRLRLLKEDNEKATNNFGIIETADTNRIIEKLPYSLTNAQKKVWNEIKNDLCSNVSMSRLVQGDVGSGKTILALLAAIMTSSNGYQSAVMAPTEILAKQHFDLFTKIIRENNLELKVVLLTGSMTEKSKKQIREEIESGEADIIIGTHALIQSKVVYKNLALVVTDEQHRFGVNQRQLLANKNEQDSVHVLVMSATPIPRTLAIILYGDLSISIIDEVPAHKLPIKNAVVGENYRKKAYEFMQKEIEGGHQVYIICPLVEESEGLDAKNVIDYSAELSTVFGDTINVGCLHGKMKPKEKQQVMNEFLDNNIHILVSTTVVEVGVNVPNATVMLIENADRFGLAQLHQLRGRVGRGDAQSYCIFMSGNSSKNTMERLGILKDSNDGFKIAEEDLKQRGPGDFFGFRQSGEMQFRLADVFTDAAILKSASEEADKILKKDPELKLPEHLRLRQRVEESLKAGAIGNTI